MRDALARVPVAIKPVIGIAAVSPVVPDGGRDLKSITVNIQDIAPPFSPSLS